jgi:hypothetical protein
MQHVLSYPRYFPGSRYFRAYLLLYDRVSTIVPWNDQARVLARPEVAELAEVLDAKPLDFYDPTTYYGQWDAQPELANSFAELLDDVLRREARKLAAAVRAQRRKGAQSITREDRLHKCLRRAKWRYVSCQKMPKDYAEALFEKGLAIKVAETEFTEAPMLVHSRPADYLISRLTRQIVSREPVTPLATVGKDVGDILIDGRLTDRDQRMQLLALTLDIAIPKEIDELSSHKFRAIRDSLTDTRKGLSGMLGDLLVNLNIDSDREAKVFRERLKHYRRDIETRIEAARRAVPWRDRINIAVDIVGAASGNLIDTVLGGIGGGMVGAGVGVVVARRFKRLSTSLYPQDVQHVEQMAVLKNKILRAAREPARIPPRYMI